MQVCMHLHPWFEPILSSNVSITWGARTHLTRCSSWRQQPQADTGSLFLPVIGSSW